ncbi:MAG: hypothetical protein IJI14_10435 [Anaerolineaceae bacterium]|nr:hypothetical protein [Anaerolineaceae bacterium]
MSEFIEFGRYPYTEDGSASSVKWKVLYEQSKWLLIVTENVIDVLPFAKKTWRREGWYYSGIRTYLNKSFYMRAFSPQEKQRIIKTSTVNHSNPLTKDFSFGPDTEDMVFLLSVYGAKRYFEMDQDRMCKPTPFAESKLVHHHENGCCPWWLRTNGLWEPYDPKNDSELSGVTCSARVDHTGNIDLYGLSMETVQGIRPAIIIRP